MILEIQLWPTATMFLFLFGGVFGMVIGAFAPYISKLMFGRVRLAAVAVPSMVLVIVAGLMGWAGYYFGNLGAIPWLGSYFVLGVAGGYALAGLVAVVYYVSTEHIMKLILERTDALATLVKQSKS